MTISVTFYSFSKRMNSTKQPDVGTPSTSYPDCLLKADTDILRPTIIINEPTLNREYNYAYIPDFGRYYFITNMVWVQGLWHMTMVIDALASWKTEIGTQELYVTRCAQEFDGTVMDNLYPTKSNTTFTNVIKESHWDTDDLTVGTYIVGVAGQNTTYYSFTYSSLQLFLQYLLGELYATELTDNWSNIYTSLEWQANPLQFITSIMWFPFTYTGTLVNSIRVGFVDVPVVAGEILGSGLIFFSHEFNPPTHPQATTRGEYLNNAPYASYDLFYPPFGQIQLDPNLLANTDSIDALAYVDMRTGNGTLTILDNDNVVVTSWLHAKVAIPYQTTEIKTQGTFDLSKSAELTAGVAMPLASGNDAGAVSNLITGGINAIGDYARGKIPSARTLGSQGGMNALRGSVTLQCEFKVLVDEDNENRGRPYCKKVVLNTLAGYILITDADIEISCTQAEQQEIRNYLEGGFFYE